MITVAGAGPAGSSAAVAALLAGESVSLYDRSRFPRHKVCGEFLSPEIANPLEKMGLLSRILDARPARIERLRFCFERSETNARLPEPALGLSRYEFDRILFDAAVLGGAKLHRETAPSDPRPLVIATGRQTVAERGSRLFGFKAHYEGPASDAIELHFLPGAYLGVNAIEGGATNICGLAPEQALKACGFDFDGFVRKFPALRERLSGMRRVNGWFSSGPLVFGQSFEDGQPGVYRAGDCLSFVDPFTGSGLVSAVLSGRLAGIAAARRQPVAEYMAACRLSLQKPFLFAGLIRKVLATRWAEPIAAVVPAGWLMSATRPRVGVAPK